MWFLYQLAMAAGLGLAAPVLLARRGRHYLATLPARLGHLPAARGQRPLWLHAASVGEAGVAATFARALPAGLDLLVTTVTPTGQAAAKKLFDPLAEAGRSVVVTYLPFDFDPLVSRFLERYGPRALVLFESELWPFVLRSCRRRGIPVAVLNARVSDRSFARMRRAGGLGRRALLDPVQRFGAQSPQDEDRLRSLGASDGAVSLTGNLKFDTPEPAPVAGLERTLRELAGGRPVLVAGSTMPGEEPIVLDAFERLDHEALLVLAPRHPERFDEVWREIEGRSLGAFRRSAFPPEGSGAPWRESTSRVVLLDSLGELASIYRLAAAAFIGGSLVPTGGHNPIEAARFGVPVLVGPSMENFRRIARDFEAEGGLTVTGDGEALSRAWRRFLDRPDEAAEQGRLGRAIVNRNRGAVERSVELLSGLVDLA
ncbi:MAG: 3-deoxy-D-manno-octulosonic acid transferase [Acidobacteria bacterium]|nr:3-deoxy-D-manno-octulosonic acid transferase [Acidobacteriota bacterium]